ncbi:MAG: hypothetical protein ACHQX4_04530 [Gemmatimonadales bacterium]
MRSTDAPAAPRSGFILPTTLLVMTLLTVMLTAAFIMASAEFRASDNSLANSRALALAQAGLENYFSQQRLLNNSSSYDSVRITFSNGYADVVGRRVRADTLNNHLPKWLVRSIGTSTDPKQPGQPQGQRAVAQMAELNAGLIPAGAALTAVNGVTMYGANGNPPYPIDGTNYGAAVTGCSTPSTPYDDTAAVVAPTGGYNNNHAVDGTHPMPHGSVPPSLGSASAVYDLSHVDWARVLAGDFSPDYVGTLPTCYGSGCTVYSSYYIVGDVTVPSHAKPNNLRALLVATGNVTLQAGVHWDGIIIAGGRLIMSASDSLHGMAITGLNCGTSSCPSADSIVRTSNTQLSWDWCYTHAAIGGLNGLVPLKNTWVDTWSLY